MKKAMLLIAIIATSARGSAQKQWLSLSLYGYSGYNQNTESKTSITETRSESSVMIYPAISYNRFLGKDWGIGLEVGYKSFKTSTGSTYDVGSDAGSLQSQHSEKIYRVSPSLFQNYSWKKYRGIVSIAIPLELRSDMKSETTRTTTTNAAYPQRITDYNEVYTSPRQLSIGAFANLSVQRQIAGGLYFGPQLGFGIVRASSNGTATSSITSERAGEPKTETVQNIEGRSVQSYFNFVPSLNLCYYF